MFGAANVYLWIGALLMLLLVLWVVARSRRKIALIEMKSEQIDIRTKKLEERGKEVERMIKESEEASVNAVCLNSLNFDYPVFLGGPSIDPHHARYLLFILLDKRPKKIIEFGSGSSTIIVARALKMMGKKPDLHISIDHDARFLKHTKEIAHMNGVVEDIEFAHCPLDSGSGDRLPWYTGIPEIVGETKFDLVIVDGPPAYEDGLEMARAPAMEYMRRNLAPGSTVVLDDFNRPGERAVAERWRRTYPDLELFSIKAGKGVGVFTVGK